MKKLVIIAVVSGASFLAGTQFSQKKWAITDFKYFPIKKANAETLVARQLIEPQRTIEKIEESLEPTVRPARKSTVKIELEIDNAEFWRQPSRASEIMKFGYPGFDNLRTYEDFVLSYDRRMRTAHWVVEHLAPERMTYDSSVDRSKSSFKPDTSIHPYFQSQNSDYFRSGYDRGHLAAAGNHRRSQIGIDQTFFLTNMSPQVGKGFNRDKWNDLERHVRRLARRNRNVFVCTGPLYLPQKEQDGNLYVKYKVIGENHVAVPTHFFKVALIEKEPEKFELEAYLMPNQSIPNEKPISDFLVPLDTIERTAGFLIFDQLPKDKIKMINGQKISSGIIGGLFSFFYL